VILVSSGTRTPENDVEGEEAMKRVLSIGVVAICQLLVGCATDRAATNTSRGCRAGESFVLLASNSTPVQVVLLGAPLQLFSSSRNVAGLRISLGMGSSPSLDGLDLGVMNYCGRFSGIQLGFMNSSGWFWGPDYLPMTLWEFDNGIFPHHLEGGGERPETLASRGAQLGFMNGVAVRFSGLQLGFGNTAEDITGCQIGVGNTARRVHGVQMGTIINEADEVTGLQIGLLWNKARVLHGVQIGLLNFAGNGVTLPGIEQGFPIINAAF